MSTTTLLPTGSEGREVLGIRSIPIGILPSCQDIYCIILKALEESKPIPETLSINYMSSWYTLHNNTALLSIRLCEDHFSLDIIYPH